MRNEVEIKERLSYWKGFCDGFFEAVHGGEEKLKLEVLKERAKTYLEALLWVLEEEKPQ